MLAEQLHLRPAEGLLVVPVLFLELLDLGLQILHDLGAESLFARQRMHHQPDADRQHDDGKSVTQSRDQRVDDVQEVEHRSGNVLADPEDVGHVKHVLCLQWRQQLGTLRTRVERVAVRDLLAGGERDVVGRQQNAGLGVQRVLGVAMNQLGRGLGNVTPRCRVEALLDLFG